MAVRRTAGHRRLSELGGLRLSSHASLMRMENLTDAIELFCWCVYMFPYKVIFHCQTFDKLQIFNMEKLKKCLMHCSKGVDKRSSDVASKEADSQRFAQLKSIDLLQILRNYIVP